MYTLIPINIRIYILTLIIITLFLLGICVYQLLNGGDSYSFNTFYSSFGFTLSALTFFSLILSFETLWKWLYPQKWLTKYGIPAILGSWEGTISSNYSRLEAIRKSAASIDHEPIDVDSPTFVDTVPLLCRKATIQIVGSLWHIRVILKTNKANDNHPGLESKSVVAKVVRDKDGSIAIWYIYDAQVSGEPSGNDSESHRGAAVLKFNAGGIAEGTYWNQRNWSKGMNAAGRLEFRLRSW